MNSALEPACEFAPFAPRPISFLGLREISGWMLKAYSVTIPSAALDDGPYAEGLRIASDSLPQPPSSSGRLGVGFVIFHQAHALDYLVLCWWGRENELSVRVFLRDRDETSAPWRKAQGDESFCVWDLEILWHERNAWVETVMNPDGGGSVDDYLARTMATRPKT